MIPIRLYAYIAVALALVLSLAYARHEHKAANAARIERDQANAANASNVETITAQTKALAEWKKLAWDAAKAGKELTTQAKEAQTKLETLRRENQKLRGDASPECITFLRQSITAHCPTVDVGLRKLTEGCDKDRRSSCTDPEAAATGTH